MTDEGSQFKTSTVESAIQRFERYRLDPWAFLSECVYTQDPVDETAPIKLYPGHREYLELFVRLWERKKMLAIPKSRRMTMSWTCIPLALWDCLFHQGKAWAFVSKKEDDSRELVERAHFSYNRIPEDKIPKSLLPQLRAGKMTQSPPKLIFEFGNGNVSKIEGYPTGGNQLRQFGFSGIFVDEAAFQPEFEEMYAGAKPTTDGGGRIVLVSSRSPGFFKKIVFDQINNPSTNFPEIPPVAIKNPMQGVELWTNPTNKFTIMDIHYTADPEKRGAEFRESMKAAMPLHQFLREYERNWETFSGLTVYPNFREDIHCPVKKPEAQLGLPLLVGVDFGLTPAVVIGQLQGNSLKLLAEMCAQNESIKTFFPKVLSFLKTHFREWNVTEQIIFIIDPAGFNRNENDERTCALEMQEILPGITLEPGPVAWEKCREFVEHYLLYIDKEGAGLELDRASCPVLVAGFKGGYRYKDSTADIEPDKVRPLKDAYSHPHDALQYLCYGARQKALAHSVTHIPRPIYNFKHSNTTSKSQEGFNYGRRIKS